LALLAAGLAQCAPTLPTIPSGTFYVTNYGAIGDGVTTNTTAIQNAINAAAAAGGGTVEFTAGVYESAPLTLGNGINLQIDAGAELQMLPMSSFTNYPNAGSYFLYGNNLHDLEISGAGTIDGQGAAWWTYYATNSSLSRPYMLYFNGCQRVLAQNITLQNSPAQHLVFKGKGGNITVQNITINTSGNSPNTDGIDLVGTNALVQNCSISDGDDNIALGSSSGPSAGILVTNCAFGYGHGVSIGSYTSGGVSNLTVFNCTFNNTANGIRMKSDNDRGGVTQNLLYANITMTNVDLPLIIYSYYEEYGTPNGITPAIAAAQSVPANPPATTPIWRDITISNLSAIGGSGYIAGIIWGRTEMPVTNVTLCRVTISASKTLDIYNVAGMQLLDSQINLPAGQKTLTLYNAQVTASNSVPGTNVLLLDGTNSANALALYNAAASTTDRNVLGANPITLAGSLLTVSNSLSLSNASAVDFFLGTNSSQVAVTGNLSLNGSVNVAAGGGFNAGQFTLFTCAGSLSGGLALGSLPAGYTGSIVTNVPGQVRLIIDALVPPQPGFTAVKSLGGALVFSGGGGPLNEEYLVLSSTNLGLPPGQWNVVATNAFSNNGGFVFTNTQATGAGGVFYMLEVP
jgi:hypothetical protein